MKSKNKKSPKKSGNTQKHRHSGIHSSQTDLYKRVSTLLQEARNQVIQNVNTVMVQAYWRIGREIVEEEQRGKSRAAYGKRIVENLAVRLSAEFGTGFRLSNLWNMRQFSLTFPILYALRRELSWTHYRILMRVENENARSFYEIECAKNRWSARELERQKGSLLYERLALSKDKKGLKRLAQKGQEIQTYKDMIKDPYILEFTGLSPTAKLYETNLEQALLGTPQCQDINM